MNATPPYELTRLFPGKWDKKSPTEWASACPECGGEDRFVVWTDREYPHWRYMCRRCNPDGGWIDELVPKLKEEYQRMTPAERAKQAADRAAEQERRLSEEIERAQRLLRELQEARAWLKYHQQQTDYSRRLWESWGIPEYWQDYWKLGYEPSRTIYAGGLDYTTPTMTIPVFEAQTWECVNVRHRLLKPPKPNDKYRPERSGLPAALFIAEPDRAIAGRTLLVEGEKKAMVSFITADDPELQVIGIPGKTPNRDLLGRLADCDPVYICLDPDADPKAIALTLGVERCRIMELPDKIDDLMIDGSLDKWKLRQLMKTARRI